MLSIKAIYDGNIIRFLEKVQGIEPQEVIITFLNSAEKESDLKNSSQNDIQTKDIHHLIQKGGAFDFLEKEEEDIYSDKDLKIKY